MNGGPNRRNKDGFPNFCGVVCTLPLKEQHVMALCTR